MKLSSYPTDSVRAMPSARAVALRVEPSFAVSPADAASIAIAGVCGELLSRQAERNVAILEGREA